MSREPRFVGEMTFSLDPVEPVKHELTIGVVADVKIEENKTTFPVNEADIPDLEDVDEDGEEKKNEDWEMGSQASLCKRMEQVGVSPLKRVGNLITLTLHKSNPYTHENVVIDMPESCLELEKVCRAEYNRLISKDNDFATIHIDVGANGINSFICASDYDYMRILAYVHQHEGKVTGFQAHFK